MPEQVLASAVRKIADIKPGIEVKVTLDRETGKLRAFAGEEEIKSEGWAGLPPLPPSRIIQKIREAEKDVVFNEFNAKVGEIISGTLPF